MAPEREVNRTTVWRRQRASQASPDEIPHGTPSGYINWKCRCTPCQEARDRYYNVGTAANKYKEWTPLENLYILTSEKPVMQLAEDLGRTYAAVVAQRKKLRSQQ